MGDNSLLDRDIQMNNETQLLIKNLDERLLHMLRYL